jgi:hypothetical protein
LRRERSIQFDGSPYASSSITAKVFAEENKIAPVWVVGITTLVAVRGAMTMLIPQEETDESTSDLLGHLPTDSS